ncbi:hypothetical protein NQ314_007887 [Rhamnusium bicolor]|uniref:DRBM domain-containing protein n=1 Tax=Rhamnusium bicolor TaxID=1586634 RepID=A0AAV8YF51_9CUCU|nr:hypothetical protein NQ314_007887 [Rhamnusium bicolor]
MLQEHHHLPQNGMQRNTRLHKAPLFLCKPELVLIIRGLIGMARITHKSYEIYLETEEDKKLTLKEEKRAKKEQSHELVRAQSEKETKDMAVVESVLVSMSPGPTLITTASIPQQPQPKANMQQVYHYENAGQPTEADQHGPAHKKIFTVTLKLGNEEYEAEGPSIKKAQHSAAAQALTKTEFKHPPPKTVRTRPGTRPSNPGVVTPTVELNALAMKRGERTVYVVENGGPPPHQGYLTQSSYYPRHNIYNTQTQPQRYGYDARRNIRGHYPYHDNRYYGQFRPGAPHNPGDPYTVRLRVGEREYPGQGCSLQAARHDAATKAIEHIKQLGEIEDSDNTLSPNENNQVQIDAENITQGNGSVTSDVNSDLKSPISLVYEIALKRNLNVTFEGPPHMKIFITQCRVGNFMADGEGNGKKISKKRAAEKMLEELSKLPPLPNIINVAQLKRKRVTNKKKTRNLIKVNMDKSSEVTEEINPISRLIQIQQANKEREPIYTVAKRNAAEALLVELGYNNNTAVAGAKLTMKPEKEPEPVPSNTNSDKGRKVTFVEEPPEPQPSQSIGGSGGRQLVPGVLLVTEQNVGFQKQIKDGIDKPVKIPSTQLKSPQSIQGVRSKDQLLYLAQLMNIHHQSTSSLPWRGPTTEASHERAALEALKVLSELGLDIAPNKDAPTATSLSDRRDDNCGVVVIFGYLQCLERLKCAKIQLFCVNHESAV